MCQNDLKKDSTKSSEDTEYLCMISLVKPRQELPKMKKSIFNILLSTIIFTTLSFADEEIPEKPVETSFSSFVSENNEVIYALSYRNAPHWHTYWKNPGDAGLPTTIEVTNGKIEELEWPSPKRYIEKGDILAYGYSGTYTRFFKTSELSPANKISIKSTWLVCKHICIPGKIDIEADLDSTKLVKESNSSDFVVSEEQLRANFNALPKKISWPKELDIVLKKGEQESELVIFSNFTNPGAKKLFHPLSMLTPFRQKLLDIKRENLYQNTSGSYFSRISAAWDGEYMDPPVDFPKNGIFKEPITLTFLFQNPVNQSFSIIEKSFSKFELGGYSTQNDLLKSMTFVAPRNPETGEEITQEDAAPTEASGKKDTEATPASSGNSLPYILLFAFLGGLILNIMPCVLPVISIKLFGLVSHSNESKKSILKHNIFYTLGVLATFLALALAVVTLKSTGENVGWGFQLQSPIFVGLMIVVLFIFSLNLFGLFEFATPGGKSLGNVQLKQGVSGDFFGGVLATILSTPCSAPFLGTALTFAFGSNLLTIILVFQAIGLGLAFPFLMTGFFPATIKLLPKPGMWMEHVKKFLGLTLILTALWLLDVFISLTDGHTPLMKLNTGLIFLFFAFYYQKNISKKIVWRSIFFILPIAFLINLFISPMTNPNTKDQGRVKGETPLLREKNQKGNLFWRPWSEKAMNELQEQGEVVFIDFTAKWCFTCKVNERLVIETDDFEKLVADKNIKLLLADWTKYDPIIGDFLRKHGYVGVPAYFIQKADGTLIKLGETISISKIEEHL